MQARRLGQDQRELLRSLGHFYLQNGHANRAEPLFRLLHMLDAADVHAARSLACCVLGLERPAEALVILEELGRESEAGALDFVLRAQALAMLGRMPEAARAMRRFIALRRHAREEEVA